MKILLFGNTGQLGWELERTLAPLGSVCAMDYPTGNLTKADSLRALVRGANPDVIINASAYTDVDRAESEQNLAFAINEAGPRMLAEEAKSCHAAFIHYSTDYVFDGAKGAPYSEEDVPNPLGVYGASKLAGERAVQQVGGTYIMLRTAWVYSLRRNSFVTKILKWARQQKILKLVSDQVTNPTCARMLAEVTAQLLAMGGKHSFPYLTERVGLYHLAGSGFTSRLEWGKAILELDCRKSEQLVETLLPALTTEFPAPAQRPLFSALDCSKFSTAFGTKLPEWQNALKLAMQFSG